MTKARSDDAIVSPTYDAVFFLAPPLAALLLGALLSESGASQVHVAILGQPRRLVGIGIGILIHAHLVAVVARSHLDRSIFRRHPLRFAVVPVLLFAGLLMSPHAAAAAIVVATFWDVYHSGAQTFGLARIYDRNAGRPEDPTVRRLDAVAQQFLYAGPIAAGVSLGPHLAAFEAFEDFDDPASIFLARIPSALGSAAPTIAHVVLGAAAVFFVVYLGIRIRRARDGERGSRRAAWLVATTGLCSVVTWGFDRWGEAFFVMNFFHAVQYLALVHATEGRKLRSLFSLPESIGGRALGLALFLCVTGAYGALVELCDPSIEPVWALSMVVSLMHFWYDGFIWSVRRGEV